VAPAVVSHVAAQIGVGADALDGYVWAGSSGRRHRVAIIDHLAVAAFDEAAEARFRRWLADDALPREFQDYLGHRDPRHTVHYTRTAGRRFEGLWR